MRSSQGWQSIILTWDGPNCRANESTKSATLIPLDGSKFTPHCLSRGPKPSGRADFDFHEVVTHLAFMHRAVFHPCVREWQSFILDHVANLFGKDSAFLMWKGQTDLTDRQLSQLGYRIIAGEGLLMRPNMLPIDYEAECEGLNALDIDVPEDSVGYVEEAWKEQ